ncbi:MAG: hypothetical protein QT05_C0051G0050 [archaeon GW2011_AR13]|nr:MAG: hypothetical protein QT05_C0051G0050 [archaeon GW2011_AR13]HIG94873.1 hypothetical protein [Nanoarchaeota archaeon]HIH63627.1 hypothetical protein [Nanoarchaeota archaeon]HIJ10118.1 hypothetical protein [Nanoarchaeota archaeon]
MITLNKSMIILPHDEIIKKAEERKKNGPFKLREMDGFMGKKSLKKSDLRRDEEGRPILNLKSLQDTYINVFTQYEYDILMQIYECGNWEWQDGDIPTRYNAWTTYKENTCIGAFEGFRYGEIQRFVEKSLIRTPQEFYDIQDPQIRDMTIEEINKWFETNKPDRRSKGIKY